MHRINDGTGQPMPDLAGMLGPMMAGLMGGGNGGMPNLAGMMEQPSSSGNAIEDRINAQVEAARASGKLPVKPSVEEVNDE